MAKLGEVCTIVSGSTPKTSVTSYWDGNIKWITPAELNEDTFYIMDSVRHITEEGKEKTGLSYLPTGTVILSSRAPIGKTAIAGCEMCCNQGFKNLICSVAIYNEYLYFFLKSKTDYLNSLGRGATFKEISKSIVENIEIPLPEVNQQKEIAEKFKKLEQLISLRKQQLAKLDELVKARFVEMFGERSSIRPQKLKEVTRRVKVGFVGTCEKYYTDNTGVPMLRTTNITSHGIDLKDLKYVTRTFHEKNLKSQVHKGDLLIARHGSNGQANVYCGDEAQCLNAIIIEPDHNITNPIFLENLINSRSVKRQIEKELVGSTQHVLNTTTLANVEVKIPAIKEQQVFAAFVERVNKQKQTVQQSLEKLELMKKALMQDYFG